MRHLCLLFFLAFLSMEGTAQLVNPVDKKDTQQRWIIKFRSPLPTGRGLETIDEVHSRFLADLKKLTGSVRNRNDAAFALDHEFKIVFNGFCVTASEVLKSRIEKLPYVEYVHEDRRLKLLNFESSSIIKAPEVWANYGATGKNTSIAIIDTGIDYTHPDLGGGIGENYKIKGGYDFSDLDNDPMDNYGHGTHVAGTAAANGPGLKGVAPDASLYAFKIYSSEGYSYDSWMIAAIERCFDPDLNPETNDAVDVANISFGRPYDPYEPLSEAVTNAIQRGLCIVVAAGNDGTFESIYTPGVTRDAITVAATDNDDATVWFSAKGPTNDYSVKPDIAAPGFQIYSAWMNGSYTRESGTSMAAPHVAGAIALIKEVHPDWTPAEIKSAIMGTANNSVPEDILHKGAGRIDVLKALESKLLASPALISFGLLNRNLATNTLIATITLKNKSSNSLTVNLTGETDQLNDAVTITFPGEPIEVPANGTSTTEIQLNIDIPNLPLKPFPQSYAGAIICTTGTETIRIPFAFFHSEGTNLEFTGGVPDSVWIIGTAANTKTRVLSPESEKINTIIGPGVYDLISHYDGDKIVIREDIVIPDETKITIKKADAKNEIIFTGVDENDFTIPLADNTRFISISGQNRNYYGFFKGLDKIYVSDLYGYRLNFRGFHYRTNNRIYDISLSVSPPVEASMEIRNDKTQFSNLKVLAPVPTDVPTRAVYFLRANPFYLTSDTVELTNPFNILLNQNEPEEHNASSFVQLFPDDHLPWQSGAFAAYNDQTIEFSDLINNSLTSISSNAYFLELGHSLPLMDAYSNNLSNKIRIVDLPEMGTFKYGHGEYDRGTINYAVYDDGVIVKEGEFTNRMIGDELKANVTFEEFTVAPGLYSVELNYFYTGGPQTGIVNTRLTFDTEKPDKNPPLIDALTLTVNNTISNRFSLSETASLKVITSDNCKVFGPCDDVDQLTNHVFIKNQNSSDWTELILPADFIDTQVVEIPGSSGTGVYDLMITASDVTGNELRHTIMAAFEISDDVLPSDKVTLISPLNGALTDIAPLMEWTDLVGVHTYEIELSTSESFSSTIHALAVNNYLQLSQKLETNSDYYWRVRPVYTNNNPGEWSAVGTFKTIPAQYPLSLISPGDNDTDVPIPVTFEWQNIHAPYYIFQLSPSPDFEMSSIDTILYTNSFSADEINNHTEYFWRVGYSMNDQVIWANYFSFTTETVTGIDEADPVIAYAYCRPNPFRDRTEVVFSTTSETPGKIIISNVLGVPVFEANAKITGSREQIVEWDTSAKGGQLPPGVYFARIKVGTTEKSLRMVLTR